MIIRIFLYTAFLLISLRVPAQKPAKSSKELGKRLVEALQTKNKEALQSLFAPPAMYKSFAPHLKEMSDAEITDMLRSDENSLEKKFENIFLNIEQFGLSGREMQWKSVKEKPLNAVATDYFVLDIILSYKTTIDTLSVEAFKNKKNWYLVDVVNPKKPLSNIIQKHSQYSWQQYYDMALKQIKEKNLAEAFKSLNNAEFLSPKSPEIYFQKGNIYSMQQDVFNALAMYRKANQIDPDYMPAYFEAAVLAFKTPEVAYEAVYNFEVCVEKEYEVFASSKYLLEIYLKQVADFEKDQYVEDNFLKSHYEKILATASKILEKAMELSVEEKTKVYLARAGSLMELERYNEARTDFEKVLSFQPTHPIALYELAWLENEFENYSKALAYAKKAYELDKNNGEILSELAFAKMQTKDFKGAINDYDTLFAMGKEFRTAKKYQNRGDCHKALKNNKMACADYKKAIEFGANDSTMEEWIKKNCK